MLRPVSSLDWVNAWRDIVVHRPDQGPAVVYALSRAGPGRCGSRRQYDLDAPRGFEAGRCMAAALIEGRSLQDRQSRTPILEQCLPRLRDDRNPVPNRDALPPGRRSPAERLPRSDLGRDRGLAFIEIVAKAITAGVEMDLIALNQPASSVAVA